MECARNAPIHTVGHRDPVYGGPDICDEFLFRSRGRLNLCEQPPPQLFGPFRRTAHRGHRPRIGQGYCHSVHRVMPMVIPVLAISR